MNGAATCAKKFWISAFPEYVLPPTVNVAFGAQSDIINATSFFDDALCQLTSICSIASLAAVFCAAFDDELELDPHAATPSVAATKAARRLLIPCSPPRRATGPIGRRCPASSHASQKRARWQRGRGSMPWMMTVVTGLAGGRSRRSRERQRRHRQYEGTLAARPCGSVK